MVSCLTHYLYHNTNQSYITPPPLSYLTSTPYLNDLSLSYLTSIPSFIYVSSLSLFPISPHASTLSPPLHICPLSHTPLQSFLIHLTFLNFVLSLLHSVLSHISLTSLITTLLSHLSLSNPSSSLIYTSLSLPCFTPLSYITIPSLLSHLSPVSQLFSSLSFLCLLSRLSHFSHLSQHHSHLSYYTSLISLLSQLSPLSHLKK